MEFVERLYGKPITTNIAYILAADIGGTNSNFGFFCLSKHGQLDLVLSIHAKSKGVENFSDLVRDILEIGHVKYGIQVKKSCFAAAGVISENRDFVKPTNVSWSIDAQEILLKTDLEVLYLVNDFEIIGYGLDLIDKKSLVQINKGTGRQKANRAILGAGTGLGKSILVWSNELGLYIPCASEGGHADFAAQSLRDLELMDYIKMREQLLCNISWEDLLSGQGIKRIYGFFADQQSKTSKKSHTVALHPDDIFNNRNHDTVCYSTFELYTQLYARCAKNLALDALALNGVYIAGGIASKNLAMFQLPIFMSEFVNCGKQSHLLCDIPVYVTTDYNVSLYGAAQYIVFEQDFF